MSRPCEMDGEDLGHLRRGPARGMPVVQSEEGYPNVLLGPLRRESIVASHQHQFEEIASCHLASQAVW